MSEFKICAKNKTELANDYGISLHGFRLWVKALPEAVKKSANIKKGQQILTPSQVEVLVKHWGTP